MSSQYNPPGILDITDWFHALFSTGGSSLSVSSYFNPRTYLNNLPIVGDVATPLSQSQINALAADGYASTIKAGGSASDAQTTANMVQTWAQTMTADTSTLDSITGAITNPFSGLSDNFSSLLVAAVLVCIAGAAVYYVAKAV